MVKLARFGWGLGVAPKASVIFCGLWVEVAPRRMDSDAPFSAQTADQNSEVTGRPASCLAN